jgi:hypothetical protein
MSGRVIRIERTAPRKGVVEEPVFNARGYKLGDPGLGIKKHHAENAVHVKTLDEAANMIGQGFSLWMGAKGKRGSLIAPKSLRIHRAETAQFDHAT